MSIEIDILNGDESWPLVEPLFKAVWPPEVVEKLPWGRFAFAYPEWRVLVQSESEGVVSHVGIQRREVKWNGRRMRAGGIGGVLTRADSRRKGYASIALNAALQTLKDEGSTDFALLFCEPHHAPFYIGRGFKPFDARSGANSRRGALASTSSHPTSTNSGAHRGGAPSICAACPGDLFTLSGRRQREQRICRSKSRSGKRCAELRIWHCSRRICC